MSSHDAFVGSDGEAAMIGCRAASWLAVLNVAGVAMCRLDWMQALSPSWKALVGVRGEGTWALFLQFRAIFIVAHRVGAATSSRLVPIA